MTNHALEMAMRVSKKNIRILGHLENGDREITKLNISVKRETSAQTNSLNPVELTLSPTDMTAAQVDNDLRLLSKATLGDLASKLSRYESTPAPEQALPLPHPLETTAKKLHYPTISAIRRQLADAI